MPENGAMSEAVNTILRQINSARTEATEASEVEPTNVLEETVAPEILFAKFEKNFGVSNSSVLKNNLPQLFQIIDTISEKNTIYGQEELVNNLLTNVLFSELTKTDTKLQNFYNTIKTEPTTNQECKTEETEQSKEYRSLNINYKRQDTQDTQDTYTIEYPDFLDDAFDTIVKKIRKNPDYNNMVTIEQGTKSATDTEIDSVVDDATVAATLAATLAATVVAPGDPPP